MSAMQLDWKFGPEGLEQLGDKQVLLCFPYMQAFRTASADVAYCSGIIFKSINIIFAWTDVFTSVPEGGEATREIHRVRSARILEACQLRSQST